MCAPKNYPSSIIYQIIHYVKWNMLSKSSNWISVLFTISQNSQYRGLLYQDLSVRPASFLPNITYTAQGVFYLTLSQSKRVVGMWLFSCYFTIWKNNLCLCLAFQKILSWPYFVGMNCAKTGKMYLEFIVECTKSPLDILFKMLLV